MMQYEALVSRPAFTAGVTCTADTRRGARGEGSVRVLFTAGVTLSQRACSIQLDGAA